jgi:hypothetical protein
MKNPADALSRLPELPVELFELGAKLDYSETTPVITNRPDIITAEPPAAPHLAPHKPSYEIRTRHAWVGYPKVVCFPYSDLVFEAVLNFENSKPDWRVNETDLAAIAAARRYYKLTHFRGGETAFGCEVRYGPWFATVIETESCYDNVPSRWDLVSSYLGLALTWLGSWNDMPSVPHLNVIVDLNSSQVSWDCCSGYERCLTSNSCVLTAVGCQDPYPV